MSPTTSNSEAFKAVTSSFHSTRILNQIQMGTFIPSKQRWPILLPRSFSTKPQYWRPFVPLGGVDLAGASRCWNPRSTNPQEGKRHSRQCKPQSKVYFQLAGVWVFAWHSRFQQEPHCNVQAGFIPF
jgi:hypothetical protein